MIKNSRSGCTATSDTDSSIFEHAFQKHFKKSLKAAAADTKILLSTIRIAYSEKWLCFHIRDVLSNKDFR